MPLRDVTLSESKAWRASLDASTESTNAAAYWLVRSMMQAAEEELIDRAPPKIRGASSAPVKRVAVPATFDELAMIVDEMPDRLRLLIVLAAFVGLREGELLELRHPRPRQVARGEDAGYVRGLAREPTVAFCGGRSCRPCLMSPCVSLAIGLRIRRLGVRIPPGAQTQSWSDLRR